MGEKRRQEQLALGEVPNIASRIEGLAAPNTVVISDATAHLVQGYFDCQALGAQTLEVSLRHSRCTTSSRTVEPGGVLMSLTPED